MNKFIFFGFVVALFSSLSALAGNLVVSVGPTTGFLNPAAEATCVQIGMGDTTNPGVLAPSFQLTQVDLVWQGGTDALNLTYLQVVLTSDALIAGSFVTYITGAELSAMFAGKTILMPGDAVFNSCALRAGGMQLVDPKKAALINGELTVVGMNSSTGSVMVQQPFALQYNGTP